MTHNGNVKWHVSKMNTVYYRIISILWLGALKERKTTIELCNYFIQYFIILSYFRHTTEVSFGGMEEFGKIKQLPGFLEELWWL